MDKGEMRMKIYDAVRAHELELNRAAIQFEHAILSPLFLLNGGAAVAFLTLVGAASGTESSLEIDATVAGLACALWAIGLGAAALATYLGFQSQRRYTRVERLRRQAVERVILASDQELVETVAPDSARYKDDAARSPWTMEAERAAGWRLQKAFHVAAAVSLIIFSAGVVFAAVSVLSA
jgi:hypothetical protein